MMYPICMSRFIISILLLLGGGQLPSFFCYFPLPVRTLYHLSSHDILGILLIWRTISGNDLGDVSFTLVAKFLMASDNEFRST
mmetsp:Transcript_6396/g.9232  ORF Transcript_6396/g.9232 Transcript_6396/m.9232 type:complete len:83 (+) Transcript_6396:1533-1781(+)